MRIILGIILSTLLLQEGFAQQMKQSQTSQAGQVVQATGKKMTLVAHQYAISVSQGVNTDGNQTKLFGGMMSSRVVSSTADSLVLVELYLATNPGDTAWVTANGWLTAPLAEWQGVGLDGSGRVNYLDLSNNNLSGALPESFKNLDSLRNLYFYVNPNLSGNLFDFLVNYPVLERVSAHDCNFTGTILPAVFHADLLEIRVFNNQFSGEIPLEIGNSPLMYEFNMANNLLTGVIPITIGELKNVRELNLSSNQLNGTIPVEIGQMDSLRFLFLENCNLEGEVPVEILNALNLEGFWFSQNSFSGTLPNIFTLPKFKALNAGGNPNLLVELPDNLGELTQLELLSIWNTRPNGGPFPEGVYNLTNLYGLDLSEQRFTGTIDSRIGNLVNLDFLYLRNNLLEGAFPIEISAAGNLNTFDIGSNNFSFMPDISSMANLQNVFLSRNQLQLESLVPFAGIENYNYSPQKRVGTNQELTPGPGSSFTISSEITDFAGSNYQWLFNRDTLSSATNLNLNITDYRTFKGGAYVLQASHPELPDLVIFSAFINVKSDESKTKWFVDNDENHTADFRDIYQAVSATSVNDTIYIAGSTLPYKSVDLFSSRVILGPGYFLEDNPKTQYNKVTARSPFFNVTKDAEGAQVYGMDIEVLYLNNQSSSLPDTLKNVVLSGNKVGLLNLGDKNDGIEISRSFINNLQINATTVVGVIRSYDNINVHNNIIDTVSTLFRDINATNNGLNNFVFDNNTIGFVSDSINDVAFNNNIIDINLSGNSTNNGNIDFGTANFVNNSGSLTIDNDFQTQDVNLDKGAFSGTTPYVLSGLPPIPAIYDVVIGPRLSLLVSAQNQDPLPINRLRYLYRKDQLNSNSFQVLGFTPAQDMNVQFLPNRSVLEANASYEIVVVAIDENGKRSHRTYVPYETIAASLSGTVVDIDASAVNNGDVKLFAINPFANKYDTAAVQQLGGNNSFNFQNLILGDYIILANPSEADYPDLIPTYLGNTIDWELADTLRLQQSISNVRIEVEKLPAPPAEPQVGSLSGIFEEEFDEADSSLRQVLPRRRVGGAGVSVRRVGNTTRNASLRLFHANTDLVAYVKTNENGEYEIPDLPEGEYAIRFEYPGVETDETSDVFFDIEDDVSETVQVDAKVENGQIVITNNSIIVSNGISKDLTISAYPNPANDYLNVAFSYLENPVNLRLIDMKGRIVYQSEISTTDTQLFIGTLEQGVYLVNLTDGDDLNVNLKIIKR